MVGRLLALLAILALAVLASVGPGHAARMGQDAGTQHAAHAAAAIDLAEDGRTACHGEVPRGAADAGVCDLVCAGLSAVPIPTGADAGQRQDPACHDWPTAARHTGRAPGLAERPPKIRLP